MMSKIAVTILICTCNRAESLRRTIAAIGSLPVPTWSNVELLIVDNASKDHTAQVVQSSRISNMPLRYCFEGTRGKSSAYNTGIAAANGDIFLCSDDDIVPQADWIERMCHPIIEGRAEAVQGGIRIAPHLERPWLKGHLRMMMASTDMMRPGDPVIGLCGANMAFSRKVLETVGGFDPELGPGALGFGEETLFMLQLQGPGYRIVPAWDVLVEHHFDGSRLNRAHLLNMAERYGMSGAYIDFHWKHENPAGLRRRSMGLAAKLAVRRLLTPRTWGGTAALEWEVSYICRLSYMRYFQELRGTPRNYERHGMRKLTRNGLNSSAKPQPRMEDHLAVASSRN